MKKPIVYILLIVLLAGGFLLLKKRKQAMTSSPLPNKVMYTVTTVIPETKTISQTRTFLAEIQSTNSIMVSSKLNGRINELLVNESQNVKKGDLLMRIDDQDVRSSIAALQANSVSAKAQREHSKSIYERNKKLFAAGGLSQEKLDASKVSYGAADARVKEIDQNLIGLNNQLNYSDITAPFTGIIGSIFLRSGDLVSPGKPVLSLNSIAQKLTFGFAPAAQPIQSGQDVLLEGKPAGEILTVYNDAKAGLWVAEVVLSKRIEQPAGSFLTIEVVTKTATGCAIPVHSLLHRKQGESLMSYQDGKFVEKPVKVIIQGKDYVLIDPVLTLPVAKGSEAKLSLLPTYGSIRVSPGMAE